MKIHEQYKLRLDQIIAEEGYSHSWIAKTCGMREYEIRAARDNIEDLHGKAIFLICKTLKRDINEMYHKDDTL